MIQVIAIHPKRAVQEIDFGINYLEVVVLKEIIVLDIKREQNIEGDIRVKGVVDVIVIVSNNEELNIDDVTPEGMVDS